MTFHTFPIACLRNPVNPPRSVFSITFLLPEDDTPDVIPRHTMLRHAYHVSATRNFRLTPALRPTQLQDLRPLPLPPLYASPLLCAPHHALARRARVRRRSTHVRQPSACRTPCPAPPRPIPTRPIPARQFHVKHERTDRPIHEDGLRHAPGLPAPSSRPPSSLRSSCAAGAYGIAQLRRG